MPYLMGDMLYYYTLASVNFILMMFRMMFRRILCTMLIILTNVHTIPLALYSCTSPLLSYSTAVAKSSTDIESFLIPSTRWTSKEPVVSNLWFFFSRSTAVVLPISFYYTFECLKILQSGSYTVIVFVKKLRNRDLCKKKSNNRVNVKIIIARAVYLIMWSPCSMYGLVIELLEFNRIASYYEVTRWYHSFITFRT